MRFRMPFDVSVRHAEGDVTDTDFVRYARWENHLGPLAPYLVATATR
jgi:hypothetical protein